jgi:hypothetical protein
MALNWTEPMTETDEVVVAIEPEPPIEKAGEKIDAGADLQNQFKDLQAQSERDKDEKAKALQRETEALRRASAAEAQAERARQNEEAARSQAADSQLDTVESGLAAAKAEGDAAEAAYAAAMEAGNFAQAAKEHRKIAAAEARIARLDEAKADIEARKVAPETRREQPTEASQVRQPPDPVEAFISGPIDAQGRRRAPETQTWLRDHKDYISEPKKFAKLQAAHHDAVASDIAPDTPEYFAHVETFVGLRKAEGTNGRQEPKPARRASVPAAPVTPSGGGTGGSSPTVTLTRGEAISATDGTLVWNYDDPSPHKRFKKGDPIGHQEMARRKLALQQQGQYDKTYLEQ